MLRLFWLAALAVVLAALLVFGLPAQAAPATVGAAPPSADASATHVPSSRGHGNPGRQADRLIP